MSQAIKNMKSLDCVIEHGFIGEFHPLHVTYSHFMCSCFNEQLKLKVRPCLISNEGNLDYSCFVAIRSIMTSLKCCDGTMTKDLVLINGSIS